MDPFVAGMEKFIKLHHLLDVGDGIVVGFSGGPDSTALLVALNELRSRWRWRLIAAHLDHGLRAEAAADAEFAAGFARRLGVEFVLERADVAGLAREKRTSIEAAGRWARYRFLQRLARDTGCRRIAVAHHRDDQIENVLWRFLTGSGSDGLAGMRPRQGPVVRPLLSTPQREILSFLERNQIPFRIDATNQEPLYFRNRLRHQLLPLLRREYNRNIDEALWRTSKILADEADYLEQAAAGIVREAAVELLGRRWYKTAVLRSAPAALRRRALRMIVWSAVADSAAVRLSEAHVSDLEAVVQGLKRSVLLPGGIQVENQQGHLHVGQVESPAQVVPDKDATDLVLPVPGGVEIWPPWMQIRTEVLPAGEVTRRQLTMPGHAYLDFAALGRPTELGVRRWLPGDRMQPLGAPGRRKLQDIFVDRRVPRHLRRQIPVITCKGDVVWVVGVAVEERTKVHAATKEILHIWVEGDLDIPVLR